MQGMFGKKLKEDPLANSNIRAPTGENLFMSCSDSARKSKDAEYQICVLSFPIFRDNGKG